MKGFRFSLLSLLVGVVLAGGVVVWLNVRSYPIAVEEIKCHPVSRAFLMGGLS